MPTETDLPILMNAPMVRRTLADEKTVTRRPILPGQRELAMSTSASSKADIHACAKATFTTLPGWGIPGVQLENATGVLGFVRSPFGGAGGTLWVRETWGLSKLFDDEHKDEVKRLAGFKAHIRYAAGPGPAPTGKLRPSIFLPRAGARLELRVVSVGVERLQDISQEDATREGIRLMPGETEGTGWWSADPHDVSLKASTPRLAFMKLWQSTYGDDPITAWSANPWVWVVRFERVVKDAVLPLVWKRDAKGNYAAGDHRVVQHRLTSIDGRRSGLLWQLQSRGVVVKDFTYLADAKAAAR